MSYILDVLEAMERKVLHSRPYYPFDPNNDPSSTRSSPNRMEIVHDPTTGQKKPYEIWAHYPSGNSKRHASFGTEKAALSSKRWKHGSKPGWWLDD
jgi:hypothetical protein